jgi:hypothetical protein
VDGQGSAVRFAGNGSPIAVVAWSRFPSGYTNNIGFSRSTDNGVTWSAPVNLTTNFLTMDQVLGNDRVNNNPSVAIDKSNGPFANRIYVVYSNNNSLDVANVAMQRSLDGGITFSAPILLNSRPGADRAQWFPYVTVDRTTGRVSSLLRPGHRRRETSPVTSSGMERYEQAGAADSSPSRWIGQRRQQPNLGD